MLVSCIVAAVGLLVAAGCSTGGGGEGDVAPDWSASGDSGPDLPSGEVGLVDLASDTGDDGDAAQDVAPRIPWCPGYEEAPERPGISEPGLRLRAEGWVRGDLHLHTTYSDGEDTLATVLALADYLREPVFLAAHPEYEGNGLDFLAITDHRVLDAPLDPDWHSETLMLIPGEEIGGPGHANGWGLSEMVTLDAAGDGAAFEDWQAVADNVHGQGGLLSMNHPYSIGIEFPWDIRNHDAVEIWNTAWAPMAISYGPADLEPWEAAHGPASAPFRKGMSYGGVGGNMQALKMVEAQLALGMHPAVVGGSDRHALFLPGFPTTWVKAGDPSMGGVLSGIASKRTFVSRGPAAATVELSVLLPGKAGNGSECFERYEMGDVIGIPTDGSSPVTFRIRVGRAEGGLLRLIRGHAVEGDDALEAATLGEAVFEASLDGPDVTVETQLIVAVGDWVYPMVLEPLVPAGLPKDQAKLVPKMVEAALKTGPEDYDALIEVFWDVIDFDVVLAPQDCDPAKWDPNKMQCAPPDAAGIATFYLPDFVGRALNALIENGQATDWCVGAVGTATVFEAPGEDLK
jgi:hypothetical protein